MAYDQWYYTTTTTSSTSADWMSHKMDKFAQYQQQWAKPIYYNKNEPQVRKPPTPFEWLDAEIERICRLAR